MLMVGIVFSGSPSPQYDRRNSATKPADFIALAFLYTETICGLDNCRSRSRHKAMI